MATKPFFGDSESSYFDPHGRPSHAGVYEFRRYDGMKILYTLDWMQREEGEEPRLKVVRCSRISEFPSPPHALNTLDGAWVRWLGPIEKEDGPGREETGQNPRASGES